MRKAREVVEVLSKILNDALLLVAHHFCPVLFLLLAIYARTIFNCFSVLLAMMVDGWCQGLRFGNSKVS